MSLLITNGRIVTATDDYVADVFCDDHGRVAAIGRDLPSHRFQAGRTIDATAQYVLPGGIDVHTHLDMPFGGTTSTDDFETGTIAAAHERQADDERLQCPQHRAVAAAHARSSTGVRR